VHKIGSLDRLGRYFCTAFDKKLNGLRRVILTIIAL
jgi:hypothetical protein